MKNHEIYSFYFERILKLNISRSVSETETYHVDSIIFNHIRLNKGSRGELFSICHPDWF